MMRWDILNALIEKNNYESYLEIGYYKGWSFDQVNCEHKTAVDPNPCKTPEQESWEASTSFSHIYENIGEDMKHELIYKLSSDEFFSAAKGIYDIIFIDGLHEAVQVYRDIQNSLKHLSPGGTIVLHDCNPPKYEHTTTGIDGCWTGDTYKALLKAFITFDINYNVVDTDWGVGVVRKGADVRGLIDLYSTPGDISDSDWDFFDKNRKQLLKLITVEEFKEKYL